MQTQTGTRSRQVRKAQPLPSDLLLAVGTQHPKFWLLAWLDATQKHAAIKRMLMRAVGAKRKDELTQIALSAACGHFEQEARDTVDHCHRNGLLPLCWEGTRAMDDVGVAA